MMNDDNTHICMGARKLIPHPKARLTPVIWTNAVKPGELLRSPESPSTDILQNGSRRIGVVKEECLHGLNARLPALYVVQVWLRPCA